MAYRCLRCGDLRSLGITKQRNGPFGLRDNDYDYDYFYSFILVDDVILTNVQDPTGENAVTRFRRIIHHLTAETGEVQTLLLATLSSPATEDDLEPELSKLRSALFICSVNNVAGI